MGGWERELNERGVVVSHVGEEWAVVGGRKERKEKKEKKDWKNNNIIIWPRNIDCSRKIPKNTRR